METLRSKNGAMAVNLSIKNAPEHIVAALRERARRNHRSLQGELMAIVEAAANEPKPFDLEAVMEQLKGIRLNTETSSVEIVREMRDNRYGDQGR